MLCRLFWIPLALAALGASPAQSPSPQKQVDFEKDVFPIFSRSCVPCHGARMQQGQLRLDAKKVVLTGGQSGAAVVPGKSADSLLYQRVALLKGHTQMPPFGPKLPEEQLAVIRAWIDQGAVWPDGVGADVAAVKKHWSYVKPVRPPLPEVRDGKWPSNAIDRFILARLEKEGMPPAAEAPRHALVRRLSFDLRGLPPTLDEVDAFEKDKSPDAYEKLVDRMLASPHYGERWAQFWLDLARYADTNGYESDEPRTMWAWRDWVIESFNRNLPFDRFTIEQLAGDLIDSPTDEQIVATGFHRNTLVNSEAGAKDDEYRDAAVKDRVDTTGTVWLGSTIACAQCHNHKYDPFTQKDYYSLYAFFNNTSESSIEITETKKVFRGDEAERTRREAAVAPFRKAMHVRTPELAAAQAEWERQMLEKLPAYEKAWTPAAVTAWRSTSGTKLTTDKDGWWKVAGRPADRDTLILELPAAQAVSGVRVEGWEPASAGIEAWSKEQRAEHQRLTAVKTEWSPWYEIAPFQAFSAEEAHAAAYPPEQEIDLSRSYENGTVKWKARPEWKDGVKHFLVGYNAASYLYRTITAAEAVSVWVAVGADHGVQVWLNGQRLIKTASGLDPLPPEKGVLKLNLKPGRNELLIKYTNAAGYYFAFFHRFKGIESQRQVDIAETQHGMYRLKEPAAGGEGSALTLKLKLEKGSKLERFRILTSALPTAGLAEAMDTPKEVMAALHVPAASRSDEQRKVVEKQFRSVTPLLSDARARIAEFDDFIDKNSTTTLVMHELPEPRDTFIQARGNFLTKGTKVQPEVPSVLGRLPDGYPRNRLGLARWIVNRDNPITARAIINHFWGAIFGRGIVGTGNDFGVQGDAPTHPELLDWLAVEFMDSGWDLKHMMKLIVMSSTYRQDSHVDDEKRNRDPENKLLARAPRLRIAAENVRDAALAISGLLSEKVGGASAFPPLPPSVFDNLFVENGIQAWPTSEGEDRYRRGLYTFQKRTGPYPAMSTFDAPDRSVCIVERPRSNTPLQALTTLNDQAFVEAAGGLAKRLLSHEGNTREKLAYGFRLATARGPNEHEILSLLSFEEKAAARYRTDEDAAAKLVISALRTKPSEWKVSELAPWIAAANVILNLDETITKE